MLTKSRIQNVILINWKGMFFHPFNIDSGLTILEGGNGTGKTTVMIAAYICLMPDLKYLNFQNVTTLSGRRNEDKGLYGRLGKGDLVFSLLDILTTDGKRHLMGVRIIKRNYPRVGFKHFAIQDLDNDANLEDILLKDIPDTNQQEITDIQEIGLRAQKHNGSLVTFRYVKDYFRFMFDNGISPLRLTENDERKQYNQLLYTSLYGGLSRSLQSSLRDYLLPEDNTLISSLQDMENNLLSCRRTRSAINRYHSIREILQNVYQTGQEMFSSAFLAARMEAEQTAQKALFLRQERRAAKEHGQKLSDESARTNRELKIREEEREQATTEWLDAKEHREKCQNARNIRRQMELKRKDWERQRLLARQAEEDLSLIKKKAENTRSLTQELTRRQVELAEQLSDAGQAWETLSKEAGLFTRLDNLLKQARRLWGFDDINPDNALEWLKKAETAFQRSQEEHNEIYQLWKEANLKREHFKVYHQALEELVGSTVSYENSAAKADEEISAFYKQEELLKKEGNISIKIRDLESSLNKRAQIQKWLKLAELSGVDSSEKLDAVWQSSIRRIKELESEQNLNAQSVAQKEREIKQTESELPELKNKLEQWERFQEWKKQLEDSAAANINNLGELSDLRKTLDEKRQKFTRNKFELEAKQEEYKKLFGSFSKVEASDSGLDKLAKQGHGVLLADRYENIPLEWSANMESRLGPLAKALVVKNAEETARKLADNQDRPEVLWLVEKEHAEQPPESVEISDSFLVRHGQGWRFGRLPEIPSLGKEARQQRTDSLREKIKLISRKIERNFQNIQQIEKNIALLNKLAPLGDILEKGSPLTKLKESQNNIEQLQADIKQLREEEKQINETWPRLKNQEEALRKCFPYKELLDQPQLETERENLLNELENIQTVKPSRHKRAKIVQLSRGIEILKEPPENHDRLKSEREKSREDEESWRLRLEIMQRIKDNLKYFKFADKVPLLERRKGLTRHLKERLTDIRLKQEESEKLLKSYSESQTEAERKLYKEEKLLLNLEGRLSQLQQNLAELELEGDGDELARSENLVREKALKKEETNSRATYMKQIAFRLEAEEKIASENVAKAQNKFKKFYPQIKPALKYWRIFRNQAEKDGNLQKFSVEYLSEIHSDNQRPEVFWRRESASRAALLKVVERLDDAGSLLEKIQSINSSEDDNKNSGRNYQCLAIWREIRDYLNQVIPIDMRSDDLENVQRLIIQKLENLRQNLEQQENTLLNYIEAIPNHIMAQIRKQKSRVRRLNQQLEKVKFGFLQTIRINIEIQNRLKEFLIALPEKLDYFTKKTEEETPAADLLASLYEEMGAGKIKGDLLLDYRHYLRLNIEVKREGGERFEKVTSTNLSTGESIGVGMAVLIIMLMSWEEQSRLLRNTDKPSGLRFLLLDESSRLDQKALHTLSDFCRRLELQLLIAAPSVEKTLEGTTHHLTRGHFNGREEVIVRGRRFSANQEETAV